jgi:HlyD family secretion protein
MTAGVDIVMISQEAALTVPLRAIQSEGGASYVRRRTGEGFERVEVSLGVMTETQVEITEGLSEGDVVSVAAAPGGDGQQFQGPMAMFRRDEEE